LPIVRVYKRNPKFRYMTSTIEVEAETAKAEYHPIISCMNEPHFILESGEIDIDPKKRKAVWTVQKDNPNDLYFTCPWCLGINKIEEHFGGSAGVSVWCSGKCLRHLNLDLRLPRRTK
jgi:hypothetical protein